MRINDLTLRHFGIHRDLRLTFQKPIAMILGENDSGKSTIKDAINFALRGVCNGLDEGGGGIGAIVTNGQDPKTLEVIANTSAGAFSRKPGDGPRSKAGQSLAVQLGTPADLVALCLEWEAVLTAPEKEAKKTLLGCLGVSLTRQSVKALLHESDFNYIASRIIDGDIGSLGKAYEAVYARRRDLGRSIKAFRPAEFAAFREDIRGFTVQDAREALDGARATLSRLERELSEAEKASARSAATTAEIDRQIESLAESLAELRTNREATQKAAAGLESLREANREALAALVLAQDAARGIDGQIAGCEAVAGQARATIETLRQGTAAGVCPLCRTKGLTTGKIGKVIAEIDQEAATQRRKAEDLRGAKSALNIDGLKAAREQAAEAAEVAGNAAIALAGIESRLHEIGAQMAELQARRAALPQCASADAGERMDEGAISRLRERIGAGKAVVAELARFIPAREAADRAQAEQAKLEAEYSVCDRLAEALAPAGPVYSALIASKIAPLEGRLNRILEPMGYRMAIALDPFDIKGAKIGRPLVSARYGGRLCSSAKLRLSLAIQSAIAIYSGLGLVVMDDADRIQSISQGDLAASLKAALAAGVDQIIVCATLTTPREEWCHPADRPGMADRRREQIREYVKDFEFILLPQPGEIEAAGCD